MKHSDKNRQTNEAIPPNSDKNTDAEIKRIGEEALRISEERLRYASTAADIGMWHWDMVNNDLVWNDKCKELHGYPPDCPVTYEGFLKTLFEEDRQRVDDVVQRSLREKSEYSVEMRVLLPDGQLRWILSKGCGLYDEQGKPVRMHGVSMDITERKKMEAEMKHFASFPILNPTPIIEMDSDGKVTFCNMAAEEVLGKTECLDNSNPLIPADLPEMLRDLRQNKVRQFQRSVETDGLIFDELIYLAPEYDTVRIYAVNVTERRRLEEERSRLAASVESSDDAIIAKTLDGIIVEWNRGAENLYGYTASEIKGRHISTLAPADRLDEVPLILEKIGRGERVEHIETMRVTKDGRRIPVLLTISPIKDTSGRIIGASTIAHDITNRKRAEEKIEQLNTDLAARAAELESANRELEAFSYSVAHDLRRPLTTINGYCQVIQDLCGDKLDEQCTRYLQETYEGTLRMNQLIDTLLNLSRLTHVELHREPFDLSTMVHEIAAELAQSDPARRVMFRIAEGIPVNGDARLIRVVMENLLGNAWKYTGAREEAVIEFGVMEIDGQQAFFVRDNGPGFDMAHADKLFAPFQRLPGADEFHGHGIGLATVERIIRRHGGRVWAEGEPGKGATFYFTVPGDPTAE